MSNALTISVRPVTQRNALVVENIRKGVRAKTWGRQDRSPRAARRAAKREMQRNGW
jgi:hypothetical protein